MGLCDYLNYDTVGEVTLYDFPGLILKDDTDSHSLSLLVALALELSHHAVRNHRLYGEAWMKRK